MKYRALRGVCVGVGEVFTPDDAPRELDPATANFLVSINAVKKVDETEAPAAVEPAPEPVAPAPADDSDQKSTPAKSGKKEK